MSLWGSGKRGASTLPQGLRTHNLDPWEGCRIRMWRVEKNSGEIRLLGRPQVFSRPAMLISTRDQLRGRTPRARGAHVVRRLSGCVEWNARSSSAAPCPWPAKCCTSRSVPPSHPVLRSRRRCKNMPTAVGQLGILCSIREQLHAVRCESKLARASLGPNSCGA